MKVTKEIDLIDLVGGLRRKGSSALAKEIRSAYRVLERLNPLERLYFSASVLDGAWRGGLANVSGTFDFGGLVAHMPAQKPIEYHKGFPIAHSIEDGGVLGAILWLQKRREFLALFGNDLAYTRLGLDLVARDTKSGKLLLCEAKGTTSPWLPPGHYLRETRRKGRQLSWRWCWQSLVEFSRHGPTAALFLECFRDALEFRAERVLVVSRLKSRNRWLTVADTTAFPEKVIRRLSGMDGRPNIKPWKEWLRQLDSGAGQSRQERLSLLRLVLVESYVQAGAGQADLPEGSSPTMVSIPRLRKLRE